MDIEDKRSTQFWHRLKLSMGSHTCRIHIVVNISHLSHHHAVHQLMSISTALYQQWLSVTSTLFTEGQISLCCEFPDYKCATKQTGHQLPLTQFLVHFISLITNKLLAFLRQRESLMYQNCSITKLSVFFWHLAIFSSAQTILPVDNSQATAFC